MSTFMDHENVPFEIGDLKCVLVSDGHFEPPGDAAQMLFSNAPAGELADVRQTVEIAGGSAYSAMLIRTGAQLVLIDTGAGSGHVTTGRLVDNLRQLGVSPADIDVVVITHGHGDHIGGATDEAGHPRFVRARYILSEAEWSFWSSDAETARITNQRVREHYVAVARAQLSAISAQTELVSGAVEIAPGVSVMPAPGHTPGHMAVVLSSAGAELLDVTDAVLHPIHLQHPDWVAVVDVLPVETVATRMRLLESASERGTLTRAYHFPWPGLGRVTRSGDRWSWQPADLDG